MLAVGQGLYAAMRFIASGLMMMKEFKPRYMPSLYLVLCVIFSIAAMTTHGTASVAMIILVLSFESVGISLPERVKVVTNDTASHQLCFATIFSLALRGQTRRFHACGRHLRWHGLPPDDGRRRGMSHSIPRFKLFTPGF